MTESEHPAMMQKVLDGATKLLAKSRGKVVNDITLHSGGVGTNGDFFCNFLFCFSVISCRYCSVNKLRTGPATKNHHYNNPQTGITGCTCSR